MHPHQMDRRADAVVREMMLRQPDRVVAGAVHGIDPGQRAFVDDLERIASAGPAEELKNAEFHERVDAYWDSRGGRTSTLRWRSQ